MPILDQGINLLRFTFSFFLVFVLWPKLMFSRIGEDWVERFFTGYIKMVALTIVLVYLLVIIKLYEIISLFWIMMAIAVFLRLPVGKRVEVIRKSAASVTYWVFDLLDGRVHPFWALQTQLRAKSVQMVASVRSLVINERILEKIMLAVVLLAAGYMRFMEPLQHAAPLMSDSSVTLAWMKYIEQRILFHDGIYPQGFHIYLSLLHKFSGADALYSLKYTGPLNGVLTTLGIYLFVAKLSGRVVPGIVAAFVFGVMGQYLPIDWERQAASNAQEFALVFLLPAWHYLLRYLETNRRDYLWTAMAAFAIIGFVHSLVLAFVWGGLGCLVIALVLFQSRENKALISKLLLFSGLAGVVAALPLPLGLLTGKSLNSSATEFLTAQIQTVLVPAVTLLDKLGLAGLALFTLYTVWKQRTQPALTQATFIFFTGIVSFLMYMYLGTLTHNSVLTNRMGIFWSMLLPVGCGLGWSVFLKLLTDRVFQIEAVLCVALLVGVVAYVRPDYSQTYRMLYDSTVNQYLRIAGEYTATEWMMVSEPEGYALVLGRAWHMQLRDFWQQYDPASKILVSKENGELKMKDIFIFSEKKVYPVDFDSMKEELALRQKDYAELAQWVEIYKENHGDMTVYYDDPDITVYQIHHPETDPEKNEQIWGQT